MQKLGNPQAIPETIVGDWNSCLLGAVSQAYSLNFAPGTHALNWPYVVRQAHLPTGCTLQARDPTTNGWHILPTQPIPKEDHIEGYGTFSVRFPELQTALNAFMVSDLILVNPGDEEIQVVLEIVFAYRASVSASGIGIHGVAIGHLPDGETQWDDAANEIKSCGEALGVHPWDSQGGFVQE